MIQFNCSKILPQSGFELEVNFTISRGEILCVYGDSGAGKTTLLRLLSGLETPDSGVIQVGEKLWFSWEVGLNIPVQKREVGMVFQSYALFENMTVKQNLLYASGEKKMSEYLNNLLDLTGLSEFAERYPKTLSGGQQQRLALIRAMAKKPEILLLDEPLSALDQSMRTNLQDLLLELQSKGTTIILVSHDLAEIYRLGNKVLHLDAGKVKSFGTPTQLFGKQSLSGKFQMIGTVVDIQKQDVVFIVSVIIGQDLVKVVANQNEVSEFKTGDRVLVASKAFNPMIRKIDQ